MENDFISLGLNDLSCDKICHKVQELINKYIQSGKVVDNSILHIQIKNISHTIDKEQLETRNIEHKE